MQAESHRMRKLSYDEYKYIHIIIKFCLLKQCYNNEKDREKDRGPF
jgi:hypothetical protein